MASISIKICNSCAFFAKEHGYKLTSLSAIVKERRYFCQMNQSNLPEVSQARELGSCHGAAIYKVTFTSRKKV